MNTKIPFRIELASLILGHVATTHGPNGYPVHIVDATFAIVTEFLTQAKAIYGFDHEEFDRQAQQNQTTWNEQTEQIAQAFTRPANVRQPNEQELAQLDALMNEIGRTVAPLNTDAGSLAAQIADDTRTAETTPANATTPPTVERRSARGATATDTRRK